MGKNACVLVSQDDFLVGEREIFLKNMSTEKIAGAVFMKKRKRRRLRPSIL